MKSLAVLVVALALFASVESFFNVKSVLRSALAKRGDNSVLKFTKGHNPVVQAKDDNTGYAVNCGPKDHNFTFSWRPKNLEPTLDLHILFDMVTSFGFDTGVVNASVYIGGDMIGGIVQEITCDYLKERAKKLHCPIKKGDHLKYSRSYVDVTTIPEDTYRIQASLSDKKTGALLICAEVTVTVE